jgi:hypothetical protein
MLSPVEDALMEFCKKGGEKMNSLGEGEDKSKKVSSEWVNKVVFVWH